jgi:hypothetical protein
VQLEAQPEPAVDQAAADHANKLTQLRQLMKDKKIDAVAFAAAAAERFGTDWMRSTDVIIALIKEVEG